MTNDEDFLAAILASPADDLPRLVYADYLEETGREELATTLRWFVANPDYRQSNPIQVAVPTWPEVDRFKADPSCVVRRGFVAEVRLPLAAFLGRPCGACDVALGVRRYHTTEYDWAEGECTACHGTGQLPGIAADLFLAHPIERVVPTDLTIFPSSVNCFYYVGGLGMFPQKYWRRLESYRDERSARLDAMAVLVEVGRERAAEAKDQAALYAEYQAGIALSFPSQG